VSPTVFKEKQEISRHDFLESQVLHNGDATCWGVMSIEKMPAEEAEGAEEFHR
jgi:hypothetical protein